MKKRLVFSWANGGARNIISHSYENGDREKNCALNIDGAGFRALIYVFSPKINHKWEMGKKCDVFGLSQYFSCFVVVVAFGKLVANGQYLFLRCGTYTDNSRSNKIRVQLDASVIQRVVVIRGHL